MGLSHGANERVVFLDGSEVLVPIDPVRLNHEFNYKVVTTNQDVAAAVAIPFTWLGGTVRPLSPVHLRGVRNAAGDLFIEWTRRERLTGGLRDLAGTPLSEEAEIYLIEIYSGATLKRTIRNPHVSVAEPVVWSQTFGDPGIFTTIDVTTGELVFDGGATVNSAMAASNQPLSDDFICEFEAGAGDLIEMWGLMPYADIAEPFTPALPYFSSDAGANTVAPMSNAAYATSFAVGDRFSIHRTGSIVRFYKNFHLSASPVPIMETTLNGNGPYKLWAQGSPGVGGAFQSSSIFYGKRRAYRYTANLQVEDFGSAQSSVKVRVYQESAIVGRGAYIEGNL